MNLPEDIKKRLFRFVEKEYQDLPVRWVRKENFHLTLNFLGYVAGENIPELCESIRKVAKNIQSFELEFQKIEAGPDNRVKKMIWATGEKSEELAELKYQLDKALGFLAREKREFRPHITLGRIKREQWRKIFPRATEHRSHQATGQVDRSGTGDKPELDVSRDFKFSVPVSLVELYESKFEKGKRVYYVLESFSLR